jgi:hypothetical protein
MLYNVQMYIYAPFLALIKGPILRPLWAPLLALSMSHPGPAKVLSGPVLGPGWSRYGAMLGP